MEGKWESCCLDPNLLLIKKREKIGAADLHIASEATSAIALPQTILQKITVQMGIFFCGFPSPIPRFLPFSSLKMSSMVRDDVLHLMAASRLSPLFDHLSFPIFHTSGPIGHSMQKHEGMTKNEGMALAARIGNCGIALDKDMHRLGANMLPIEQMGGR